MTANLEDPSATSSEQKLFSGSLGARRLEESIPQRLLRLEEDVLALSLAATGTAAPQRVHSGREPPTQVDRLLNDRVDRIAERLDTLMLQLTEERAQRQQDHAETHKRILHGETLHKEGGDAFSFVAQQLPSMVRQEVERAATILQQAVLSNPGALPRNEESEQRIVSLAVSEACRSLHGETDFWRREVMRLDAEVVQARGRTDVLESNFEELAKNYVTRSVPGSTVTTIGDSGEQARYRLLDSTVINLKATVDDVKASSRRMADELHRKIDEVREGLRAELQGRLRNVGLATATTSQVMTLSERCATAEAERAEFRQHLDDLWARLAAERMERQERHNALTCKMENGLQRLIQKLDRSQTERDGHDSGINSPAPRFHGRDDLVLLQPPWFAAQTGPSSAVAPSCMTPAVPVVVQGQASPPPRPAAHVPPQAVKNQGARSPLQQGRSASIGSPPRPLTRSTIPMTGGALPVGCVGSFVDARSAGGLAASPPPRDRASVGSPVAVNRSPLVSVRSSPVLGLRSSLGASNANGRTTTTSGVSPVSFLQTPQQSHRPLASPCRSVERGGLKGAAGAVGASIGLCVGAPAKGVGQASPPSIVGTPALQGRGSLTHSPPASASPQPRAAPPHAGAVAVSSAIAAGCAASRARSPVMTARAPAGPSRSPPGRSPGRELPRAQTFRTASGPGAAGRAAGRAASPSAASPPATGSPVVGSLSLPAAGGSVVSPMTGTMTSPASAAFSSNVPGGAAGPPQVVSPSQAVFVAPPGSDAAGVASPCASPGPGHLVAMPIPASPGGGTTSFPVAVASPTAPAPVGAQPMTGAAVATARMFSERGKGSPASTDTLTSTTGLARGTGTAEDANLMLSPLSSTERLRFRSEIEKLKSTTPQQPQQPPLPQQQPLPQQPLHQQQQLLPPAVVQAYPFT